MENQMLCQSCGIPINGNSEVQGANADASKNTDYCVYCFKDGAFTEMFQWKK